MSKRAFLLAGMLFMAVTGLAIAAESASETTTKAATTQPASGLEITEIAPGESSPSAKTGDVVLVFYTGKLANGTVFDSTDRHGGKPFQFTLGQGHVIKGWDQGVVGMKLGEKRKLVIPPDLAYGANGSPPTIPANATLTFEIELCGIVRLPASK